MNRMEETSSPSGNVTVERVIELFTGDQSKDLTERHVHALERLSRSLSSGMPLRELGKVDRLFDLTLLLIMEEGKHEFVEPLCALLATLSRPFSKKSAADEFRASNLVSTLFSRIGTCFADGVPQPVQIAAAKAIAAHASAYGNRPSILSLSNITEADVDNDESLRVFLNNQRLIARSSAPQGIVRGLQSAVSSADGPLIETVVDTVAQLSYFPENCAILLEEGVLSVLAEAFPIDIRKSLLTHCVETVWNLLDSCKGAVPPTATDALSPLASRIGVLLDELLAHGYRGGDKELRNELVVLAYLMASDDAGKEALLVEGVVSTLMHLAVSPELRPIPVDYRKTFGTVDALDLQFRELVWNTMHMVADSDEGLEEALKGGFLKCLLQYVDSDGDVAGRLRLEPAQYVKRRDQALTLLRSLLHRTPAAFVEHRGVVILLRFLQQCDDAVGTTRGLSLLLEACSHAECLSDLQEEAAVDLLLLLAQDPALAEEARGTCYLAMATLGRSGPAFVAQFRERGGVPLMHRELQRACARDPTMPSSFVATAVGAAWACICPSKRSLATFLVADGMDVVLDLLDSGGQHLRGLLLGFLADMLHNPKSHAFFHEWRSSQSGEGAAHVLLEMWREEESARGVGAGATLRSMTRPLEGMGERTNWVPSMRLTYSLRDPKKLELVEAFDKGCNGNSLLTKIFCCLHLLGWEGLEYISAADKVTLTMVKGYVRLRQGEIWADIQAEMEGDSFEPTEADMERIEQAIENTSKFVWEIRDEQEEIAKRNDKEATEQERVIYTRMIEQHALDMASKLYKKDTSELSMKERQMLKQKKDAMLKSALRPQETYVHLSSTRTKNSLLDNTPSGPVRDDSGPRFSLPADDSGQPLPSSASSQRIGPGGMLIRSGSQRSGYGPALSRSGSLRSQGAAGRGRGGEGQKQTARAGPRVFKASSTQHILQDNAWQPPDLKTGAMATSGLFKLESSLEPHPEEEEEHEAGLDKPGRGVGQDGAEGSPEAVKRDNKTWVLEGMASGRLTPEDDRSIDESPHTNMKFVMNVPVDAA